MPALANPKHERFAQELAKGKTADEAYRLAGYKASRSAASRLSANVNISTRVKEILERAATRVEITQAKVLEELAKIGFSNMLDYMAISADGDPYVALANMSREQAAAVQQIVVEDYKDGRGDDARDVRKITFKLADKEVTASRGKWVRAEPIAALYEQGRISHVGTFAALEDEMVNFGPNGMVGDASPDRVDALVWALTELLLIPLEIAHDSEMKSPTIPI